MAKELNLRGGKGKLLFTHTALKGLEGKRIETTGTKPELILQILELLGVTAPSEVPLNLLFAVSGHMGSLQAGHTTDIHMHVRARAACMHSG